MAKQKAAKAAKDLQMALESVQQVVSATRLRVYMQLEAKVALAELGLKKMKAERDAEEDSLIALLEGGAKPEAPGPLAAVDVSYRRNISWKGVCEKHLGPLEVQRIHDGWPLSQMKRLVVTEVAG